MHTTTFTIIFAVVPLTAEGIQLLSRRRSAVEGAEFFTPHTAHRQNRSDASLEAVLRRKSFGFDSSSSSIIQSQQWV